MDNILLASNDMSLSLEIKSFLSGEFEMKDLGETSFVLDIQIVRDRSRYTLGLSQTGYIEKVLIRYGMQNCALGDTLVAKGDKLSLQQCPHHDLEIKEMQQFPYALAIGSLMYVQMELVVRTMRQEYNLKVSRIKDKVWRLPFRGHDESSTSSNRGNFLELLKWYSSECPEVTAVVGMNAPGNNQMIAPKIQKKLVNACAVETTNVILADLGDRWFTLLLDEACDCSVKEQMAVVIRYVNKYGEVIERFMVVVHVATTTAACLKEAIDSLFAKYGLSVARLRGQGYDGASNMFGEFNGLKSLIMKENPYTLYVHCFAHQLQLVVVAVAQANQYICDFMWIVGSIVNTSASSCKRADKLRQLEHDRKVKLLGRGEISSGRGLNQETSLATPRDTRWGSHHSTLCRIEQMWPSVIEVLQNLIDDGDRSSKGLSRTLVERMERYEFVFILLLMKRILAITNHLSTILQEKDQNIVNAMRLINNVKCKLQKLRDSGWDILLEDVKKFCNTHFIEIINMTDNINSRSRLKRDGKNVIDIILQEMDSRFSETTTYLLINMSCLDPRNSFSRFDAQKLVRLTHFYEDDFSWNERMLVEQELETYIDDVRSDERFEDISDLGALAKKMIETMKNRVFPLVYRMIELALLLPVATATVERVFSAMNIVKTDLRNRIGDEWMNDSLVVYIEKDVFNTVDNELILQCFQNMESRIR
ncbi:zinc finger MYM-type protein 1-like [Zingiber officinale]|uniref:zinc finger MYM-type protein 1-like n=1 Tax=Zingiber officinale TaxID=94328 RepID=UPI001C4D46EF|nr:zinc finger MYM-type protein 1-like [Zingiber officinale]